MLDTAGRRVLLAPFDARQRLSTGPRVKEVDLVAATGSVDRWVQAGFHAFEPGR
jgi:hypothetical protein